MAVKLLVIDAMRNTRVRGDRRFDSRSCTPAVATCTSSPSTTTPSAAPGRLVRAACSATMRSISGKAAASLARRCGSANTGGGTPPCPATGGVATAVCASGAEGAREGDGEHEKGGDAGAKHDVCLTTTGHRPARGTRVPRL